MTTLHERVYTPAATISAGISRKDITPPEGIRARNWGPATWDRSVGQHHSMTLTALAIRGKGTEPLLMLALDATWWRREEDERVLRERVIASTGIPAGNLMIALSHTHAGPILSAGEALLDGGDLIPGYLEAIGQAAEIAGAEALASTGTARIEWTTGRCQVASNRELVIDGQAVVGYFPAAAADDTVMIARLTTASGQTLATIVNYACHPTTLSWQNQSISPDYVGAMRQIVESETGHPCLFLQGASGELAPREQYTGNVAVADRHGAALGYAVLAALNTMPPAGHCLELTEIVESGASLAMWVAKPVEADQTIRSAHKMITLDLAEAPSLEELKKRWADIDPRSLEERLNRVQALREGLGDKKVVDYPVWVWRMGDAVIVGSPGEPYSQLQVNLRKRFPDTAVMVANFVNGPGFMYLPTVEAYEMGAYQAWQTLFAAGSLERVEEHAAKLIGTVLSADVIGEHPGGSDV